MKKFLIVLAALMLAAAGLFMVFDGSGNGKNSIPSPGKHYYYDEAGVLSYNTKSLISEVNEELKEKTGAQIVVAAVKNMGSYSNIEAYANQFFNLWKIGDADKDNGVLIVAAMDERKMRIEVGYGLEDCITDGKAGKIISDIMVPKFKTGSYDKGFREAFEETALMVQKCEGVELNSTKNMRSNDIERIRAERDKRRQERIKEIEQLRRLEEWDISFSEFGRNERRLNKSRWRRRRDIAVYSVTAAELIILVTVSSVLWRKKKKAEERYK